MRASTVESPRLAIITGPQPRERASFGEDVRAGLLSAPKYLASKYFYDELGSALFDAITLLPEYYLTRAETQILREWGWEIVRALGNPIEFVELGSGSAIKTRILIEEALRVQRQLRYSPIDISGEALRASAVGLVQSFPALTVRGYAADYFTILAGGHLQREMRTMVLLMGSNIGNYEPRQARALLDGIRCALKPGDGLLLGTDLKKDARVLELAYDDPAGVTAAFNKNLLARINRELSGEFDLRAFDYQAHYEPQSGAVKSYLRAKRSQTVRIGTLGIDVPFAQGERIHTESSHKFSPHDVEQLARETGFRVERAWTDRDNRFSVNLLVL